MTFIAKTITGTAAGQVLNPEGGAAVILRASWKAE